MREYRVGRREKKREKTMTVIPVILVATRAVLFVLAVFSLLYTTVLIYHSGIKTSFLWFFPVICVLSLALCGGITAVLCGKWRLGYPALRAFLLVFWCGVLIFSLTELFLAVYGKREAKPGADYVIVLGAQVRGTTPSRALYERISLAAEYLKENPQAKVVATGGQGKGEEVTEALAIRNTLLQLGIEENRILLEERSTSTKENLLFAKEIVEADGSSIETAKILLVTNDFHVFRAVKLAEKLGYTGVFGAGTRKFMPVTIQCYVREFFALVKELFVGNL